MMGVAFKKTSGDRIDSNSAQNIYVLYIFHLSSPTQIIPSQQHIIDKQPQKHICPLGAPKIHTAEECIGLTPLKLTTAYRDCTE